MLETVFRNLISNAIKFTPLRGSIRIFSRIETNTVRVSIKDTGVGISENRVKMLFDFSPTSSSNGTSGEISTGLGLLVVHDSLALNNAGIEVQSTSGEGTEMTLVLPKA